MKNDHESPIRHLTTDLGPLTAYDWLALLLCAPAPLIFLIAWLCGERVDDYLAHAVTLLFLIGGGMIMLADIKRGHIRGVWRHRTPRLFYATVALHGLFMLIVIGALLLYLRDMAPVQ